MGEIVPCILNDLDGGMIGVGNVSKIERREGVGEVRVETNHLVFVNGSFDVVERACGSGTLQQVCKTVLDERSMSSNRAMVVKAIPYQLELQFVIAPCHIGSAIGG